MNPFKMKSDEYQKYKPLDTHGLDANMDNRKPSSFDKKEIDLMSSLTGFLKRPGKIVKKGECEISRPSTRNICF